MSQTAKVPTRLTREQAQAQEQEPEPRLVVMVMVTRLWEVAMQRLRMASTWWMRTRWMVPHSSHDPESVLARRARAVMIAMVMTTHNRKMMGLLMPAAPQSGHQARQRAGMLAVLTVAPLLLLTARISSRTRRRGQRQSLQHAAHGPADVQAVQPAQQVWTAAPVVSVDPLGGRARAA